jgi:hypothetical protein
VRDLSAVTVFPPPGVEKFPVEWIVETSSGRGRFRPVKDATVLVCAGVKDVPAWVEVSFKAVRAKEVRVRPEPKEAVKLARVEVLGKPVR